VTDIGPVTAGFEDLQKERRTTMRRFIKVMAIGGLIALGLSGVGGVARAVVINRTAVRPYGTDSYTRYFVAGEVVTVAVSGDGDTDLDIYVKCPCGDVVARDDDPTDDCVVRFRAPESGTFTILVVNRGSLSNLYFIGVDD
jgi:hypothetical protein